MCKDEYISIDDFNAKIDRMRIYNGTVRGIKRDNPINRMHVHTILARGNQIIVLAEMQKEGTK
jgi:hypothetical protein